jgi:hypothetical protein
MTEQILPVLERDAGGPLSMIIETRAGVIT